MANKIKLLLRILIMATIGMFLGTMTTHQITKMYSVPTHEELTSKDNNSKHFLISNQKKIIERSRQSAVRVMSYSADSGGLASSSGTYIRLKNNYFIITTNHGIVGDCASTKVMADSQMYDCISFIERNDEVDYALIQINRIEHRQPIRIPSGVANTKRDWLDALAIMSKTYYTGFPNSLGPLTIDGKVMGYSPDDYIYINSYAWSGSSGSGVFSQKGDYIGYVLAIDVGPGFEGPTILENVVLVVPAYRINWASVFAAPQIVPEAEDTANYSEANSED